MASRTDSRTVTVTTSATLLTSSGPGRTDGVDPHRRVMWIHNADSTNAVYLGESDVTTAAGLLIPAGEKIPFYWTDSDFSVCESLYGIAASGTIDVRVHERFAN